MAMSLRLTAIFITANAISLVESGCLFLNPLTKDFKRLCEQWWDQSEDYRSFGSSLRNCINLINEKCPDLLETTITVERAHETMHGEIWLVKVTATHKVKKTRRISNLLEDRVLCWDNDGKFKDCGFWWSMAKVATLEMDRRDYCIQNILKHCDNMITKVEETSLCGSTHCRKGFEVRAFTYKDEKEEKTTVNREVTL